MHSFIEYIERTSLLNEAKKEPCPELQTLMDKVTKIPQYKDCLFKTTSGVKTYLLVDYKKKNIAREDVLKDIYDACGGTVESQQNSSAKIVAVDFIASDGKVKTVRIGTKPANLQGNSAPGVDNETSCYNLIDEIITCNGKSPVDIIFRDKKGNEFVCKDAISVTHTAKDTGDGKKADIVISSQTNKYSISLKKMNAEYWESISRNTKEGKPPYDEITKTFQNVLNAKFNMQTKKVCTAKQSGTSIVGISPTDSTRYKFVEPYESGVAWKPGKKLANAVMFGSDCGKANGCIIVNDFMKSKNREFEFDDFISKFRPTVDRVVIDVDMIVKTYSDIENTSEEPYILLRNGSDRGSFNGYKGIRAAAVQKRRVSKNVLDLDSSKGKGVAVAKS